MPIIETTQLIEIKESLKTFKKIWRESTKIQTKFISLEELLTKIVENLEELEKRHLKR